MKDKLIGVIVTVISSGIMFMTYSFFGSFETRAGSETKYEKLNTKIDKVLCYLDDKHCLISSGEIRRK